jgi:hypothetical protein
MDAARVVVRSTPTNPVSNHLPKPHRKHLRIHVQWFVFGQVFISISLAGLPLQAEGKLVRHPHQCCEPAVQDMILPRSTLRMCVLYKEI